MPSAPPAPAEFPGATVDEDALLRHTVFTGTLWFCGTIVALLLPLTGLLAAGWRPHDLGGAEALWWIGAALALIGVLGIAWAGCPVVSDDPGRAAARKSVTIRAGVVLVLAGFAIATITTLVA